MIKQFIKIICVLFPLLQGCTNEDAAYSVLQRSGYTNIQITGYDFGSCAKDDSTCTGFIARGPTGQTVNGAVGCGWVFKNCTIRIEP